ncbi:chalcone isomerase family protein [Gynuella sp.]|uniref:chalcone isomerase family protein n=1 Tax=Gynuella sp. TaxID=2969146 RepID=UPI003D0B44EF
MHKLVSTIGLLLISQFIFASQLLQQYVPDAQLSGETTRYRYLFFNLYDASLYAPNGQWSMGQPFALSLTYLRHLKGEKIAEQAVAQIRSLGFDDEVRLASWYSQLLKIIPDVGRNSTLTGVYLPGDKTIFLQNEKPIGTIRDPDFGHWFFSIWLSDKSPEPQQFRILTGTQISYQ